MKQVILIHPKERTFSYTNPDLSVQIYIFSPVCFYTDGKFDGGNFSAFNTKYAKMRQRGEGDTLTFDIDRFGEKREWGSFGQFRNNNITQTI